jgi:hypothetical protein
MTGGARDVLLYGFEVSTHSDCLDRTVFLFYFVRCEYCFDIKAGCIIIA